MKTLAALAFAGAVTAGAALADPPVLTFGEGEDRLEIATAALTEIRITRQGNAPPAVLLRLDTDSARAFAAWTAQRIGQEIPVTLCGQELMRPRLMDAITGGSIMVATANTADARQIASRLRASECPKD